MKKDVTLLNYIEELNAFATCNIWKVIQEPDKNELYPLIGFLLSMIMKSVKSGWLLEVIDVENSFLNGEFPEIYKFQNALKSIIILRIQFFLYRKY